MGKNRRAWWILGAAIVTTIGLYTCLEVLALPNIEPPMRGPGLFAYSLTEPGPTESENDAILERELALIIEEFGFKERRRNPYPDSGDPWTLTFRQSFEIDALSQPDFETVSERIKNACTGCKAEHEGPLMKGQLDSPVGYKIATGQSYRTVASIWVIEGAESYFYLDERSARRATITIERRGLAWERRREVEGTDGREA